MDLETCRFESGVALRTAASFSSSFSSESYLCCISWFEVSYYIHTILSLVKLQPFLVVTPPFKHIFAICCIKKSINNNFSPYISIFPVFHHHKPTTFLGPWWSLVFQPPRHPELCAGLQCKAAARAEGLTQACGHEDHQPLVVPGAGDWRWLAGQMEGRMVGSKTAGKTIGKRKMVVFHGMNEIYPLVMTNSSQTWKMAIEIS